MVSRIDELEESIIEREGRIEYMREQEYSSVLILAEEGYLFQQKQQLEELYGGSE